MLLDFFKTSPRRVAGASRNNDVTRLRFRSARRAKLSRLKPERFECPARFEALERGCFQSESVVVHAGPLVQRFAQERQRALTLAKLCCDLGLPVRPRAKPVR